jgi:hypothetical protein
VIRIHNNLPLKELIFYETHEVFVIFTNRILEALQNVHRIVNLVKISSLRLSQRKKLFRNTNSQGCKE